MKTYIVFDWGSSTVRAKMKGVFRKEHDIKNIQG